MGKNINTIFLLIALTAISLLITGCGRKQEGIKPETVISEITQSEEETITLEEPDITEETEENQLLERVQKMNLQEKIGQLVIIGINGAKANEEELKLIAERSVGGVIFFQRNVENETQLSTLIESLNEANGNSSLPLFLSIDEEGGKVTRLSNIFPNFRSAYELGKLNNEEASYKYGSLQALKLKYFGINMDFSPVLDVSSNAKNRVIGDRSISQNPEIVAIQGVSIAKGIMSQGIIPVVKHFPGHGDTSVDSHEGLPVINKNRDRLFKQDIYPFKYSIDNGIPAVMVGHLLVTAFDDEPASVSNIVINDLLRGDLGFNGVVFSDDMTMGAVTKGYGTAGAAAKFIISGGDVALICHGTESVNEFLDSMEEMVISGLITEEQINEKVLRIAALKEQFIVNDLDQQQNDLQELIEMMDKFNAEWEEFK
ncbi:MAG: beta-N-acetylhexosaminidase [Gudongella sp.]|jgi:beta-N-acetylhexosaminidase|nr:beta-N-acetylhexosaminidase [Gudongella sp.]